MLKVTKKKKSICYNLILLLNSICSIPLTNPMAYQYNIPKNITYFTIKIFKDYMIFFFTMNIIKFYIGFVTRPWLINTTCPKA